MKLILSEHARDNGELFEQLQGNAGMLESTWTTRQPRALAEDWATGSTSTRSSSSSVIFLEVAKRG